MAASFDLDCQVYSFLWIGLAMPLNMALSPRIGFFLYGVLGVCIVGIFFVNLRFCFRQSKGYWPCYLLSLRVADCQCMEFCSLSGFLGVVLPMLFSIGPGIIDIFSLLLFFLHCKTIFLLNGNFVPNLFACLVSIILSLAT